MGKVLNFVNKVVIMSDIRLSVAELISLLPPSLLSEIADELEVDKWAKKLTAESVFKLILFSLLKHDELSLRRLQENFKDVQYRLLVPALTSDTVSWTAIRDRLMVIDVSYFEQLYEHVYTQISKCYSQKALSKYNLKRYDSTMVAVSAHLLDGIEVGNSTKKHQLKLTTEFKNDCLLSVKVFSDQDYLSEETALQEVIFAEADLFEDEQIIVFDSGLKSRETLSSFDHIGLFFVTRAMKAPRFVPVGEPSNIQGQCSDEIEITADQAVYLYRSGHNLVEHKFRLVQGKSKASQQTIFFLTNIWHLSALEVAQIYRRRWDIEVLFRFLKQEMNLSHFVCYDPNAIQVLIYCKLILAMLILIYKRKNKIKSYQQAKNRFFGELIAFVLLETINDPAALQRLKENLEKYANSA